jgi:hypothetical protein
MNGKLQKRKFVQFGIKNKTFSLFGFKRTVVDLYLLYSFDYARELAEPFVFEEQA